MKLVRYYTIIVMLLVANIICAANTGDVLVVELNDGESTIQHFYLSDSPQIELGLDIITVTSSDMSTTFNYAEVKQIYITRFESKPDEDQDETTSLESPNNNIFSFHYVDGQTVRIEGISKNTRIGLYTINGMSVPMSAIRQKDGIVISLASLQRGFYIIKCDNQSFKIYKK